MTETFTRFDAADYLTTPEGIAAFLEAAADGNDAAHLAQALGTVARAQNMSKLARDSGISREGLYKALASNGNPAFATVVRIAGALGLRLVFVPVAASVKTAGRMTYLGESQENLAAVGNAAETELAHDEAQLRDTSVSKERHPTRRRNVRAAISGTQ